MTGSHRPTGRPLRAERRFRLPPASTAVALLVLVLPLVVACDGGTVLSPRTSDEVGATPPQNGPDERDGQPEDPDDGGGEPEDPGDAEDDTSPEPEFPNRPDGFRDLTEIGFSSLDEDGWRPTDDVSVVEDPSAPRSPDAVGEIVFPEGWRGGYAPAWTSRGIGGAGSTELYVSFWLKLSDDWQGHHVGDKLGYVWIHDDPTFYPLYVGGGSDRLHSQVRIQNVPGGAVNLEPNLTDPEIVRGRWHRWEIVLVSNTDGSADGEIHWWIDGEKAGEYREVRFGSASQSPVWQTVTWRPVWGGRGGEIRADQRMWMDHIYVAGR